jgi:hypothetical protein
MPAARRRTCKLAAALIVALSSTASGELNIDVRATKLNGAPLSGGNTAKSVTVHQIGDVVSFDVFAVVVGTNASLSDDKIIHSSGSFKSVGPTKGTLVLDLVPTIINGDEPLVIPGFDGLGSSIGTQQDLDGDFDLDVGSNLDSSTQNFWFARYHLAPVGAPAGSLDPLTGGRLIGFGTFTVSSLDVALPTSINFFGRNATTASAYTQDGATTQQRSFDGILPLQILIPEPAAVWIAFAGLAFVCRHRRAHSLTPRASRCASLRSVTSCRS